MIKNRKGIYECRKKEKKIKKDGVNFRRNVNKSCLSSLSSLDEFVLSRQNN